MRINQIALSLLLAISTLPQLSRAADGATVHAILIAASKQKAPADPKLAQYEATLQRNLPESSFRYQGEGSTTVALNGSALISLGHGHRLELVGHDSLSPARLAVISREDRYPAALHPTSYRPPCPPAIETPSSAAC